MNDLKQRIKDDLEALPDMELDIAPASEVYPWVFGVILVFWLITSLVFVFPGNGSGDLPSMMPPSFRLVFMLAPIAFGSIVIGSWLFPFRVAYVTYIRYMRVKKYADYYIYMGLGLFAFIYLLGVIIGRVYFGGFFGCFIAGFVAAALITGLIASAEMQRVGFHVLIRAVGTVMKKAKAQ